MYDVGVVEDKKIWSPYEQLSSSQLRSAGHSTAADGVRRQRRGRRITLGDLPVSLCVPSQNGSIQSSWTIKHPLPEIRFLLQAQDSKIWARMRVCFDNGEHAGNMVIPCSTCLYLTADRIVLRLAGTT